MDTFAVLVFASLTVVVLIFLAIGKWYPGSGAEQVDWRPTRSLEEEIRLEQDDVAEMIEAQNARRRATGRPEVTEEGVRARLEGGNRGREEET